MTENNAKIEWVRDELARLVSLIETGDAKSSTLRLRPMPKILHRLGDLPENSLLFGVALDPPVKGRTDNHRGLWRVSHHEPDTHPDRAGHVVLRCLLTGGMTHRSPESRVVGAFYPFDIVAESGARREEIPR